MDYSQVADWLAKVDYNQTGSSKAFGKTLRVTYRLYALKDNDDEKTKQVFDKVKVTTSSLSASFAVSREPILTSLITYAKRAMFPEDAENKTSTRFGDSKGP